ncbi:ATP phosphoribosyltransferase regulatory subunit [Methylobacterium aerolatum]|uniref:ATP phosphoribosyltransferase regulatory subunit n=1 Tax=Methylobacterium aerolatum TaxID=418708 RepID=A0ABU0I703_9HYPH|nr:ATP phosphoribosyltransferase regulatory subunit [Methylobacterium aerolatum]MDQ0449471.1 ATP phosphoribosyltransferase regulatory subunit [Methylobacterium aerolatum]GJD33502.1 ATP phosphoribosyltransferase regulatory subunit [Methylobacterium aerolatum]
MTRPEPDSETAEPTQARLLAHLAAAGYATVAPPVLQPIEPFLELSGEDIRRRIFVTQDAGGAELCLRPEFTIPVCRLHRQRADGQAADYSYCGPVFRLAADEPDEFFQAGIESIGRTDTPAADAEVLGLALEGLALFGRTAPQVRLGDMGLTVALLDGLAVPPAAKRRTLRALAAGRSLDGVTNGAEGQPREDRHAGLLAAIQGQDPQGVRAFVEDVLAIAGISAVGGRSAGEIAERFLGRAAAQANGGAGLNSENRAILDRYRAVSGDPDSAARDLRALVSDAGIRHEAVEAALDLFEERTGFIAARGLPVETFRFQGGFARNLDYYTGFIFEVAQGDGPVLVGGGRYDGLLSHLGSPTPLPAVGCTFWIERATGAGR